MSSSTMKAGLITAVLALLAVAAVTLYVDEGAVAPSVQVSVDDLIEEFDEPEPPQPAKIVGSGPGLPATNNNDMHWEGASEDPQTGAIVIPLHHHPRSADETHDMFEWVEHTHTRSEHPIIEGDHTKPQRLVAETKLQNSDLVEYFGQVSVGSPPQHFKVVFDTGSGILWVPSHLCNGVACQDHTRLYQDQDKSLQVDRGYVNIKYGTGRMRGRRATDHVGVAGITVPNQDFLLSTNEDGIVFRNGRFDGVMGLGRQALAGILSRGEIDRGVPFYINAIQQKRFAEPKFSIYVSKHMGRPGAVVLGGTNPRLYTGTINYHAGHSEAYWMVSLGSMRVGDTVIHASNGARGIVDSGTSLLVGPPEIINPILPKVRVNPDCSNMADLEDLEINMQTLEGKNVVYKLTPQDYVMNRMGKCKTGIAIMQIQLKMAEPIVILGDTFLRKFYSVYNHETGVVGFATAKHDL